MIDATKGNRKVPFSLWFERDNEGMRLWSVLIPLAGVLLARAAQSDNQEQAVIEQTASTNRSGVTISVTPSGTAKVVSGAAAPRETNVDAALSRKLFEDLKTVGPLSALPKVHCMKSVSFGTSLYLKYNGETSPDLSCRVGAGSKLAVLQKDVQDLMEAAHAVPQAKRSFNYQERPK